MTSASPYSVHLVRPADQLVSVAEAIEAEVFGEAFGNSPDLLRREYGPYADASTFVLVIDKGSGEAAGTMRLVVDGPAGFKSLNDVATGPWKRPVDDVVEAAALDRSALVDVATLAVEKDHRRAGGSNAMVTAAMFFALRCFMADRGITDLIAILDDAVLDYINDTGIRLRPVDGLGSKPYLGSPGSTPAVGNLADMEGHCRAVAPDLCDLFWHGVGIDQIADVTWLPPRV